MTATKTKRIARNDDAVSMIRKTEPFRNAGGSLWAERPMAGFGPSFTGHLPKMFLASDSPLMDATYIVYSYDTPIMWLADGQWYYPSVKYSPTTTQHQHIAKHGTDYNYETLSGDWRKAGAERTYSGESMRVTATTGMPQGYHGIAV